MPGSGYANDRKVLKQYADDVAVQAPVWNSSAMRVKGAHVHDLTFTADGRDFFSEYQKLVDEHAWYAWRISVVLNGVGEALYETARNYGRAEAIIEDDINDLGVVF